MNDPQLPDPRLISAQKAVPEDEPSQGPSLTLLYTLIALAMAAAIGCAMLIVLPFYHRHTL
jgi:hypothetical protein